MLSSFLRWPTSRAPRVLDASDAYRQWAPGYPPFAHNRLMELEERAMLALLPEVRGVTALDLGCGSGRYARILRERGAARVLGLDRSAEMLARAGDVTRAIVRGDVRDLPFAGASIDIVVSGLVLGDLPDLQAALTAVARVLKPGGCVLYSDLHPLGARAGWVRSFVGADGRSYAVRHYVHAPGEHDGACRRAGLAIEAIGEPIVEFDHPQRHWPAALVIRARRPC
jgi:SAM-dependent methyltransferase